MESSITLDDRVSAAKTPVVDGWQEPAKVWAGESHGWRTVIYVRIEWKRGVSATRKIPKEIAEYVDDQLLKLDPNIKEDEFAEDLELGNQVGVRNVLRSIIHDLPYPTSVKSVYLVRGYDYGHK
jgi:hypothetical protein